VRLNYQSIGSGGGIQQIKAKTVDFGASDAPLTVAELEESGLVQFPMIVGGVVPVYTLKEISGSVLHLDGDVLGAIFLGEIKKWNDPRIQELNPGLRLPARNITVVHRSDGSGTTWIFTTYLSQVSLDWHEKVGAGKAIKWPVGVGGKGNEGVAAYVDRINGSIGYVEYAYAKQNSLAAVHLKNRDGEFVAPAAESFEAAAANADWRGTPGLAVVLTHQPGAASWPITGASFILMNRHQKDGTAAWAVLKFFDWCIESGRQMALNLDYIPLPDSVAEFVRELWSKEFESEGKPVWPPAS